MVRYRKERKSSTDKERRNSEDDGKGPKEEDSKYEKEREKIPGREDPKETLRIMKQFVGNPGLGSSHYSPRVAAPIPDVSYAYRFLVSLN